MLRVIQLSFERNEQFLFKDVSFTLSSGHVLQIRGPNGAGKTTLLRLLAGLLTPTQGTICWQGQPIHELDSDYKRQVLFISTQANIRGHLTVEENLRLLGALRGFFLNDKLAVLLKQLNLSNLRNCLANQLSSGQQRRIALAQLALLPLPLWILDEPLTALDAAGRQWVQTQIMHHSQQGGATIIATHHSLQLDMPVHELLFR